MTVAPFAAMSSRPRTARGEPEASITTSKPRPSVISSARAYWSSPTGSITASAPWRSAISRRSAIGSIRVNDVAPFILMTCRASWPIGPPPQIATRSPTLMWVLSAMRTATEVGSSRQPFSSDTESGSL